MPTLGEAFGLLLLALLCVAAADDSRESAESGSTEDEDCSCVPFHLCPNGGIGDDGSGKIVFKLGSGAPNECPTYSLRKCCGPKHKPSLHTQTTPKPATRVGCGRRNSQGIVYKIVDDAGVAAQFGEFPWMAMVFTERNSATKREIVPLCGGALIHEKVVLTAAHCAAKDNHQCIRTPFQLLRLTDDSLSWSPAGRMGPSDRNGAMASPRTIDCEDHLPREIRSGHLYNDIALLVLTENAKISHHIDILCLPKANDVVMNSLCVATGWGKNLTGDYQHVLKKVELPMVPRDVCQAKLRTDPSLANIDLHESFVCAGGIEGKDTCKGDGGGALACPIPSDPSRYQQVGIVAWGLADCGNATPSVYVDVARFRPWIDDHMAQLGLKTEYSYS